MRILGPDRSCKIGIRLFSFCSAILILRIPLAFSSCVPCEKETRAMSIPFWTMLMILSTESLAGPIVQTILVRFTFMDR